MNTDKILDGYYKDNAQKLRAIVDKLLRDFGGISQKDYDDFYSLANAVFAGALKQYDAARDFDGFLYSCLSNRIKTEITRRNRIKRRADMDCHINRYSHRRGERCDNRRYASV